MTHIIISGVLALVFFGLIYALDRQTKHWQALHDKEIQAYKRDVGEQYTLYPEGYHSAGTTLSRLLLGSAIEKALLSVAALKSTKDEYSTTDNRST